MQTHLAPWCNLHCSLSSSLYLMLWFPLSMEQRWMCVLFLYIYMEPANEWCRSCLYTGRRDARACSEQTSGHNRPNHCAIGRLFATAIRSRRVTMDSDRIRMKSDPCHLLPHFNPDTNANVDLIGSGYKTDSLNPDIFSIWNIELSRVSVYFVNNFAVDQNHYTRRE